MRNWRDGHAAAKSFGYFVGQIRPDSILEVLTYPRGTLTVDRLEAEGIGLTAHKRHWRDTGYR